MTLKYHHVYVVVENCNISAQIATPFPLLNGWHARHVRVESSRSRVPCRADIAPNKTLYNYDSDKFFSVTPRGARSQHLTPNKYIDFISIYTQTFELYDPSNASLKSLGPITIKNRIIGFE